MPHPFFIAVHAPKGGPGKSFVSANIARYLGVLGFRVLVLDMNESPDLAKDFTVNAQAGIDGFCLVNEVKEYWEVAPLLEQYQGFVDFIVADTWQFSTQGATRYAIENANLYITPVTPDLMDQPKFMMGVEVFLSRSLPTAQCLVWPNKTDPFTEIPMMQDFYAFLDRLSRLHRVSIPPFDKVFYLDENRSLRSKPVRFAMKGVVSEKFFEKLELYLMWLMQKIHDIQGEMSPGVGAYSTIQQLKENGTLKGDSALVSA